MNRRPTERLWQPPPSLSTQGRPVAIPADMIHDAEDHFSIVGSAASFERPHQSASARSHLSDGDRNRGTQ